MLPRATVADGLPLIGFYEDAGHNLVVPHCDNGICSSSTTAKVDTAGTVGRDGAVAIGSDGLALISYHNTTNTSLKVAHCRDTACTTQGKTTLDNDGPSAWTRPFPSVRAGWG